MICADNFKCACPNSLILKVDVIAVTGEKKILRFGEQFTVHSIGESIFFNKSNALKHVEII